HAEQATMKGHAPLPDLEGVPRVLGPEAEPVEQHIPYAAAQDDPEHGIENQIIDIGWLPGGAGTRGTQPREPPAAGEADQVHDAVPVNFHRAELDGNRVEAGILQHSREV